MDLNEQIRTVDNAGTTVRPTNPTLYLLTFKPLNLEYLYTGAVVVSCFMWSGALDLQL